MRSRSAVSGIEKFIVLALVAGAWTPALASASDKHLPKAHHRYRAAGLPASAREAFALAWGIDQLSVSLAESGQLVRFNYRVIDATKAKALNEKTSNPSLLDERARAVLQVPTMEKIGPLRQSSAPENGRSYWMVFSNKGDLVKPGHRVSVAIGEFRVDGLIVQ